MRAGVSPERVRRATPTLSAEESRLLDQANRHVKLAACEHLGVARQQTGCLACIQAAFVRRHRWEQAPPTPEPAPCP